MDSIWVWLLNVGASAAGSAALLGVAGYLFRSQLSHWLNKDLEAVKAKHQRDLETYKVSLITESERAKATQDVQKALALKMAERKFEAIDRLYRLIAPLNVSVHSALDIYRIENHQLRMERMGVLMQSVSEASAAATLAGPFLTPSENAALHNQIAEWSRSIALLRTEPCTLTDAEMAEVEKRSFDRFMSCKDTLEKHLERMLKMA